MYKQFFTLNNLSLKLCPNDLGTPLNRWSSSTNTKHLKQSPSSMIKDKNLNTTELTNQYFKPKSQSHRQVVLTNILDFMTQTQNGNTQCSKVTSNSSANFFMNLSTLHFIYIKSKSVQIENLFPHRKPCRILQRSLQDPITGFWYSPVQDLIHVGSCKKFQNPGRNLQDPVGSYRIL